MRHSGSWQSVWDDRILEWLRENGGTGSAKQIHDSDMLRISKPHISRRFGKLKENGLVVDLGNGVYQITEEGRGYLDEEYDVDRGVWLDRDQAEEDGPSAGATSENGV